MVVAVQAVFETPTLPAVLRKEIYLKRSQGCDIVNASTKSASLSNICLQKILATRAAVKLGEDNERRPLKLWFLLDLHEFHRCMLRVQN